MAKLPDAVTWGKQNPGTTQQDYYKWMYQPEQYAQKMGATGAEAAAFDPNASALDSRNVAANKALVGRKHAEAMADPIRQRSKAYQQHQLAQRAGFAGVSPGLQPPQGPSMGPPEGRPRNLPMPAPGAGPAAPIAGVPGTAAATAGRGFAGVQPMSRPGRGLRTSFGAAGR